MPKKRYPPLHTYPPPHMRVDTPVAREKNAKEKEPKTMLEKKARKTTTNDRPVCVFVREGEGEGERSRKRERERDLST